MRMKDATRDALASYRAMNYGTKMAAGAWEVFIDLARSDPAFMVYAKHRPGRGIGTEVSQVSHIARTGTPYGWRIYKTRRSGALAVIYRRTGPPTA